MLEQLFPGHDVIRHPIDGAPKTWNELLKLSSGDALNTLCQHLSLSAKSRSRTHLLSAVDFGAIIPKRKRDRNDSRLWSLAIVYPPDHALLFACPTKEFLHTPFVVPDQYTWMASSLGAVQFDRQSGRMVWPGLLERIGNDLRGAKNWADRELPIPFFDHHTGDFDCWLDQDFTKSWLYEHETASYRLLSADGFAGWFDKRMTETAEPTV